MTNEQTLAKSPNVPNPSLGRFIVFEGGEGAGKSTQAKLLHEALTLKGIDAIITREPGGTQTAEMIRALLLSPKDQNFSALAEVLLLFAGRDHHLTHLIKPALLAGKWVICDRFIDSTYAYQGYAQNADLELIDLLTQKVIGDFMPHHVFLIDIEAETGLMRAKKRSDETDRFEQESLRFHKTLRDAFLNRAKKNTQIYTIIDGNLSAHQIHEHIISSLQLDM